MKDPFDSRMDCAQLIGTRDRVWAWSTGPIVLLGYENNNPESTDTVNARDEEALLLAGCARIATGAEDHATDDREANVVRVAAMLTRSRHPRAARRLHAAAIDYFDRHPDARQDVDELIRRGWIMSLPRFRALLDSRLADA